MSNQPDHNQLYSIAEAQSGSENRWVILGHRTLDRGLRRVSPIKTDGVNGWISF